MVANNLFFILVDICLLNDKKTGLFYTHKDKKTAVFCGSDFSADVMAPDRG